MIRYTRYLFFVRANRQEIIKKNTYVTTSALQEFAVTSVYKNDNKKVVCFFAHPLYYFHFFYSSILCVFFIFAYHSAWAL